MPRKQPNAGGDSKKKTRNVDLPAWAADMQAIGMDEAAIVLGICKRTLTDMLKDHPHYELRGRVKKVFYPEHIMQLRKAKWRLAPDLGRVVSTVLSAPSGARELERARARVAAKQRRPAPPLALENALETVNLRTLSPRMKEALAFVATEGLAGKKMFNRPLLATFEALTKRGVIVQGATDYNYRLTEKGRRALDALRTAL